MKMAQKMHLSSVILVLLNVMLRAMHQAKLQKCKILSLWSREGATLSKVPNTAFSFFQNLPCEVVSNYFTDELKSYVLP